SLRSQLPGYLFLLHSFRVILPFQLTHNRLDPRNLLAHSPMLVRARQLAGGLLHTQVELLATELQQFVVQLFLRHRSQFARIHHITCRVTKVVGNGGLAAARRNASRAISSVTPSIS